MNESTHAGRTTSRRGAAATPNASGGSASAREHAASSASTSAASARGNGDSPAQYARPDERDIGTPGQPSAEQPNTHTRARAERARVRDKSARRREARERQRTGAPDSASAADSVRPATSADAASATDTAAQGTLQDVVSGRKPPVAPKHEVSLPRVESTDELTEEVVREGYKMLFQIPALAGYGPWWELHPAEAQALAEPTTRLLKRMSPNAQQTFSRFFDPIMLAFTAVVIVQSRIQQTQGAIAAIRMKMETEGRLRGGLSKPAAGNGQPTQPRVDGNQQPVVTAIGEVGRTGSGESVAGAYG